MLKDFDITLTQNDFLHTGRCIYFDGYGNKVVMVREFSGDKDGFRAKLTPADKKVKAAPLRVNVPVTGDEKGADLHLDYLDGMEHNGEDMKAAISMLTFLVQRWIDILYSIHFMQCDKDILKRLDKKYTDEDIAYTKLANLKEFEEFDALTDIFLK